MRVSTWSQSLVIGCLLLIAPLASADASGPQVGLSIEDGDIPGDGGSSVGSGTQEDCAYFSEDPPLALCRDYNEHYPGWCVVIPDGSWWCPEIEEALEDVPGIDEEELGDLYECLIFEIQEYYLDPGALLDDPLGIHGGPAVDRCIDSDG